MALFRLDAFVSASICPPGSADLRLASLDPAGSFRWRNFVVRNESWASLKSVERSSNRSFAGLGGEGR